MEVSVANVLKIYGLKVLFIIIALNTLSVKVKAQINNDISSFIMRNYKIPKDIDYCKWNYLVLEITLKHTNKINYKILSPSDSVLLNSVRFLKTYSVNKSEITSFPALVLISIQDNMGMCDNQYAKILTSSEVLQEIVPLISKSIKDNPKIKIINPIIFNVEKPRQ